MQLRFGYGDAPLARDETLGDLGEVGGADEFEFVGDGAVHGVHRYAGDYRVDLVVFENFDDGWDGGVVNRQDGSSDFFFEGGVRLEAG